MRSKCNRKSLLVACTAGGSFSHMTSLSCSLTCKVSPEHAVINGDGISKSCDGIDAPTEGACIGVESTLLDRSFGSPDQCQTTPAFCMIRRELHASEVYETCVFAVYSASTGSRSVVRDHCILQDQFCARSRKDGTWATKCPSNQDMFHVELELGPNLNLVDTQILESLMHHFTCARFTCVLILRICSHLQVVSYESGREANQPT